MKMYFILPLLLYLCSCGSGTNDIATSDGNERNECFFRVDRGYIIKWKSFPIPVYIHYSTSPGTKKNMEYAMDIWNNSWHYYTGKGALFESMGSAEQKVPDRSGDGVNVVFIDDHMNLLSYKQQGTTQIRNKFGGNIYDADITINNIDHDYFYEGNSFDYMAYTPAYKLNSSRLLASSINESFWDRLLYILKPVIKLLFFWQKKEERKPDQDQKIQRHEIDFISLAIHELGHLAGLVHIENSHISDSIMNPKLGRGIIRREIRDQELDYISCNY